MSYQVRIVQQAEDDLWDLYQYVLAQDGEIRSVSESPVVGPRASGFVTGKDGEAGDIGVYRRCSRTQSSRKTSRSKPDRILRQAPRAEHSLDGIEDACKKLTTHPRIGHTPPELDRIGILDYLEIHFKPYRIIYQIEGRNVFVHCVLDGRRDMQELLERRMIR